MFQKMLVNKLHKMALDLLQGLDIDKNGQLDLEQLKAMFEKLSHALQKLVGSVDKEVAGEVLKELAAIAQEFQMVSQQIPQTIDKPVAMEAIAELKVVAAEIVAFIKAAINKE